MLNSNLKKIRKLPLSDWPIEAGLMAVRKTRGAVQKRRDVRASSYMHDTPEGTLQSFFSTLNPAHINEHIPTLGALYARYAKNEFNVFGSGWVDMTCDIPMAERLPKQCQGRAGQIAGMIRTKGYCPIDWQRDPTSGYRWSEDIWYQDITINPKAGVDIKGPWEVARGHHLTIIAYHWIATRDEAALTLFQNHILDFIAHNPPRWGVNWRCTMDVAIRAANIAIALDLIIANGAILPPIFLDVVKASLFEHCVHIRKNLEWYPTRRSNHYLANICGLLVTAAYLPECKARTKWLSFAMAELKKEIKFQVHPDGTNFESSTSYHCLSSEMMLWACLYARRIDPNFDCDWQRVYRAGGFIADIIQPNDEIVQIGDTDSGRFLKLAPLYVDDAEQHLNMRALFDCFKAAFGADPKSDLIAQLLAPFPKLPVPNLEKAGVPNADIETHPPAFETQTTLLTVGDASITKNVTAFAYEDFGLYIFKSDRMHLTLRCGPIGQKGKGGHAHADQLSLTCAIDGEPWIEDPGTYLYTPDVQARNQYRASTAHFSPYTIENEDRLWALGPFILDHDVKRKGVTMTPTSLTAHVDIEGVPVIYNLEIDENTITIKTSMPKNKVLSLTQPWGHDVLAHPKKPNMPIPFSPGYGLQRR